MGVRDLREAQRLSHMLGNATIQFEDFANNERARIARREALKSVLDGQNAFDAAAQMVFQKRMAAHQASMARPLMQPNEILTMPGDRALVFMPGRLKHPIAAKFKPYWQRRDLAGRYLADPFHGDGLSVSVSTFWGQRQRRIIECDAPPHLTDLPQYRSGRPFRYVEGYKPKP